MIIRASYFIAVQEQHGKNSLTHSDMLDNHLESDWSDDEENVQPMPLGVA